MHEQSFSGRACARGCRKMQEGPGAAQAHGSANRRRLGEIVAILANAVSDSGVKVTTLQRRERTRHWGRSYSATRRRVFGDRAHRRPVRVNPGHAVREGAHDYRRRSPQPWRPPPANSSVATLVLSAVAIIPRSRPGHALCAGTDGVRQAYVLAAPPGTDCAAPASARQPAHALHRHQAWFRRL